MLRLLFYPIILLAIALAVAVVVPAAGWAISHWMTYQWFLIGAGGYFLLRILRIFTRNESWLQTFSHELSHTVVGMMFLRRIHSFSATTGEGEITHSGRIRFGQIFISLAPYCLPIFTYALLFLRLLGATKSLYIFDIMIGVTFAFHLLCFWRQTGNHQTDIRSVGYLRSYLFLIWAWLFNATIILLSIRMGVLDAFKSVALDSWQFFQEWADVLVDWITELYALLKGLISK